jgi:NAD(P)-dependent dehydrogenase (short-subunit alcohol dehydrogenase family)
MPLTTLITGASRGLGLEFAKQLAARGDRVIAAVRSPDANPALKSIATVVLPLDAADESSIAALASDLAGEPIDILINNAGVMGDDKKFGTLKFSEFQRVFATNLFGPALLAQALLPNLKSGQKKQILNISSELGSIAQNWPGFSYAYCASKAALNRITAQMAKELKRDGITVTTFCPGWNKTDMGGPGATLQPADSVAKLIAIFDRLTPADSGKFIRQDSGVIPW